VATNWGHLEFGGLTLNQKFQTCGQSCNALWSEPLCMNYKTW
jgi:hypothetical protein